MSFIHPAADTRHIIQKAMNSKSLATLAEEEDTYQALLKQDKSGTEPASTETSSKRLPLLYTKDDLADFKLKCQNKSPDEIFELLGIDVTYDDKGKKTISHYKWPYSSYSFQTAGINEEELLKGVETIIGNCNLAGSYLKNLGDVKSICGNLIIPLFPKAEDLSSIQYIGGDILCESESPEDVIKLIRKLKLNPKSFHGHINNDTNYRYYMYQQIYQMPQNLEEAIKELQSSSINSSGTN